MLRNAWYRVVNGLVAVGEPVYLQGNGTFHKLPCELIWFGDPDDESTLYRDLSFPSCAQFRPAGLLATMCWPRAPGPRAIRVSFPFAPGAIPGVSAQTTFRLIGDPTGANLREVDYIALDDSALPRASVGLRAPEFSKSRPSDYANLRIEHCTGNIFATLFDTNGVRWEFLSEDTDSPIAGQPIEDIDRPTALMVLSESGSFPRESPHILVPELTPDCAQCVAAEHDGELMPDQAAQIPPANPATLDDFWIEYPTGTQQTGRPYVFPGAGVLTITPRARQNSFNPLVCNNPIVARRFCLDDTPASRNDPITITLEVWHLWWRKYSMPGDQSYSYRYWYLNLSRAFTSPPVPFGGPTFHWFNASVNPFSRQNGRKTTRVFCAWLGSTGQHYYDVDTPDTPSREDSWIKVTWKMYRVAQQWWGLQSSIQTVLGTTTADTQWVPIPHGTLSQDCANWWVFTPRLLDERVQTSSENPPPQQVGNTTPIDSGWVLYNAPGNLYERANPFPPPNLAHDFSLRFRVILP